MQCLIVGGEKNLEDAAPLPLYFPSSTIKYKVQKKPTWKWWTLDSETFPWVEPCGQILARAILEQLGCHPSLFSVGNKVHVLEQYPWLFILLFKYFLIIFGIYTLKRPWRKRMQESGLFFLPFANEWMFSFWIHWPYHHIYIYTQITLQEWGQTANEEL